MAFYNSPGLADTYLIQGTESPSQFAGQFEQFEVMYNEGTPEFYVDQGLYYPTATNYGYICTGFESTGDWEDHHRSFNMDAQDVQHTGAANESVPCIYYTPSYAYGHSPYNPYNPFIPGAVVGVDGSYVAPQQYYTLSSYENPVSSDAYVPVVLQNMSDASTNRMVDSYIDNSHHADGLVAKHFLPSNSSNPSKTAVMNASSRRTSFGRVSEGAKTNASSGKQPLPGIASGSFTSQVPAKIVQSRGPQGIENGLNGKTAVHSTTGLSDFESSDHGRSSVHKALPKLLYGTVPDGVMDTNAFIEQNQRPRTNKSKNQLVVKSYTTRAGNADVRGNIVIFVDQYNSVDFPVDYVNAKFFVIKSYSEDDVHKSVKYNVWSSTPNGNKKLNAAYEDAQRVAAGDSRGCPIFLFFSVNASGQFCGVAEMIGPVDFHRDMDFWQQDKWSGSFPVKWHFIKDLPNSCFRHIILENNENKPMTNSRDTQEIPFRKGLQMLQMFKNYNPRTSLFDDFFYYENRQRALHEERARLRIKSSENPYLVPVVDPPRKLQPVHDFPSIGDIDINKNDADKLIITNNTNVATEGGQNISAITSSVSTDQASLNANANQSTILVGSSQVAADALPKLVDELKISSSTIGAEEPEPERQLPKSAASTLSNGDVIDVVMIGSMLVKVKGSESSGISAGLEQTPLDTRTPQCE